MQIVKFKHECMVAALTAMIFLAGVIGIHSSLIDEYTIPSSGLIGFVTGPSVAYKSEVRFMWIAPMNLINPDWDLIAQTCKDYNIDVIIVKIMDNFFARYPSAIVPHLTEDELAPAIAAAHARDIELHISMSVLLSAFKDEHKVIGSDGVTKKDWTCPTNPLSRAHLRSLVEEVTSLYDIDGFMFDYVRWSSGQECYCEHCHAKFEEDTGITVPNWPADCVEGGVYHNDFMEWRIKPINELVRDMRSWIMAIKPDVEFSAAVFGWIPTLPWQDPGYPTYNRYWIGQDFVEWVKEGYIDFVAPMMYKTDLNWIKGWVQDYLEIGLGGPEGMVPLCCFLANCHPAVVPPADYKTQVDTVRQYGADGWATWRYGGPGDGQGSGSPDITQYLDLIDLPEVFTLSNINALPTVDSCTVTWITDKPATSKVEYSTSPLFTWSFIYDSRVDFHYWDIDHVEGTIVEESTPVVSHSITLTGLQEESVYYYRVQSTDLSGTATSKVYTFET